MKKRSKQENIAAYFNLVIPAKAGIRKPSLRRNASPICKGEFETRPLHVGRTKEASASCKAAM
ncbi:hypothetical protein AGMMS50256_03620 [Betaproteobacteria bacterium]|nr:hypothetical protein AGMMS50256_03620 [Betaproteobacteria bacterium]